MFDFDMSSSSDEDFEPVSQGNENEAVSGEGRHHGKGQLKQSRGSRMSESDSDDSSDSGGHGRRNRHMSHDANYDSNNSRDDESSRSASEREGEDRHNGLIDDYEMEDPEEFLWGRGRRYGDVDSNAKSSDAEDDGDDLLGEDDYIRDEAEKNAGRRGDEGENLFDEDKQDAFIGKAAATGIATRRILTEQLRKQDFCGDTRTGDDEEAPPDAPVVLLKDAAVRMRKEQLLMGCFSLLTIAEELHSNPGMPEPGIVNPGVNFYKKNYPNMCSDGFTAESAFIRTDRLRNKSGRLSSGSVCAQSLANMSQHAFEQQPSEKVEVTSVMKNVVKKIFGRRVPVGRFGLRSGRGCSDIGSSPSMNTSSNSTGGKKAYIVFVSPHACQKLKDANLLLKREGCSSSSSKPPNLYDVEDGHLLYQHPRFCSATVYERDLTLKALAPLWQSLCDKYDEIEGSKDEEEQQRFRQLLLQLLRCLSFIATPPPGEWINYWCRFSNQLDRCKDWKRRHDLTTLPGPCQADDALAVEEIIEGERQKKSHIVLKFLRGMQRAKCSLSCPSLWSLLAKFYFDSQELIERKGRTTGDEEMHCSFVSDRKTKYTEEERLKALILEEEKFMKQLVQESDDERKPFEGKLRKGGLCSSKMRREEMNQEIERLNDNLHAIKEDIFNLTEKINSCNKRARENLDKAEGVLSSLQSFACLVLCMPSRTSTEILCSSSIRAAARNQLRLLRAIIHGGARRKEGRTREIMFSDTLLSFLCHDVRTSLFSSMQREFDLKSSSLMKCGQDTEGGVSDRANNKGFVLGSWSVTSVHSRIMARIWSTARIFYAIVHAIPPVKFSEFLAKTDSTILRALVNAGIPQSHTTSRVSGGSENTGLGTGNREGLLKDFATHNGSPSYAYKSGIGDQIRNEEHRRLLELGRVDSRRAWLLLLQQRRLDVEKQKQKCARMHRITEQLRTINFAKLFSYTDLILQPFDEDESHLDGGSNANQLGLKGQGNSFVGVNEHMNVSGEIDKANTALSNVNLHLRIDDESVLSTEESKYLQELISGFLGIPQDFQVNIHPSTNENAAYTGEIYSFAFLIEAMIKEKKRDVDMPYNQPCDSEVSYFKAINLRRIEARKVLLEQRKKNTQCQSWSEQWQKQLDGIDDGYDRDSSLKQLVVIDRIDMIFAMQGYQTFLIQEFVIECIQKTVRVDKLKRSVGSCCLSGLRCVRQMLRMLEVHVGSRSDDVRAAVQSQVEKWLGFGIISDISFIMRKFKFSTHEPTVLLAALECVLSIINVIEKLGGKVNVNASAFNRRKRIGGLSEDTPIWMDSDAMNDTGVCRVVTVDCICTDICRGEIIGNFMRLLSRYRSNSIAVNEGLISYFEQVLAWQGLKKENVILFFDLKYFLVFQDILNDRNGSNRPDIAWIVSFAKDVVRSFFDMWTTNAFLPVELLFNKQHSPNGYTSCSAPRSVLPAVIRNEHDRSNLQHGAEGKTDAVQNSAEDDLNGITQHDFMSPGSVFCIRSIFSNYERGTDYFVLRNMKNDPNISAEEAVRMAAEDASVRTGGSASGGVYSHFTHEEDCILLQYFEQFSGVRDYYTYIADLMGKHPKAIRKRLQVLRATERVQEYENHGEVEEDQSGGELDASGQKDHTKTSIISDRLTAAILGFKLNDWSSAEDYGIPQNVQTDEILNEMSKALRDACRLRSQAADDSNFFMQICVEEPTNAPLCVLDSKCFRDLMHALHCKKIDGGVTWILDTEVPFETVQATADKFDDIKDKRIEELHSVGKSKRFSRRTAFVFQSAILAVRLIELHIYIQSIKCKQGKYSAEEYMGKDLFEDVERDEGLYAILNQLALNDILSDICSALKSSEHLKGSELGEGADRFNVETNRSGRPVEEKLSTFKWWKAFSKVRALKRVFAAMGMERRQVILTSSEAVTCETDQDMFEGAYVRSWGIPNDVGTETWAERVKVFESFHKMTAEELEMLVDDVRICPDDNDGVCGADDEQAEYNGNTLGSSSKRKHCKSRHARHKKGKESERSSGRNRNIEVDVPEKIVYWPTKPTLKHQIKLVLKIVQWRKFIEEEEAGFVANAEQSLLNIMHALKAWNALREAEASVDASVNPIGDLVLYCGNGNEEEEGISLEGISSGGGHSTQLRKNILPTMVQTLLVCLAIGGQPVLNSDNKKFIWLSNTEILPVHWVKKQLKLLERSVCTPELQTAGALEAELQILKEILAGEQSELNGQSQEAEYGQDNEKPVDVERSDQSVKTNEQEVFDDDFSLNDENDETDKRDSTNEYIRNAKKTEKNFVTENGKTVPASLKVIGKIASSDRLSQWIKFRLGFEKNTQYCNPPPAAVSALTGIDSFWKLLAFRSQSTRCGSSLQSEDEDQSSEENSVLFSEKENFEKPAHTNFSGNVTVQIADEVTQVIETNGSEGILQSPNYIQKLIEENLNDYKRGIKLGVKETETVLKLARGWNAMTAAK